MSFRDRVQDLIQQFPYRVENLGRDQAGPESAKNAGNHAEGSGDQSDLRTYFSDVPLTDPDSDAFGRWPFARRLAQTIAGRSDKNGLVIALYGKWGVGKTTLLNFIFAELESHDHVIPHRFNPWIFPSEPELLIGFFTGLSDSLERSLPKAHEKIGSVIKKYLAIPAALFGRGQAVEKLGELLSSVRIELLKERMGKMLSEEGKTVVILVDDIDRLEKTEIQSVFRLVKLTANFDHVVYVLAFDDTMVSDALQDQYGTADPRAGRNFLEKIVQVPLNIPIADGLQLRNFCFEGVDLALNESEIELSDEDAERFAYGFVNGIDIRLSTPRMAKRYTNMLLFSLPLVKGELDPVDFLHIEAIRGFFPTTYEVIRHNQDVFVGKAFRGHELPSQEERQRLQPIVESALEHLSKGERDSLMHLLTSLFPRLNSLYGNTFYGAEWDETWARDKRVASQDYVSRYFTQGVPVGDISDRSIEALLDEIDNLTLEELAENLRQLIDPQNAAKVVEKIRLRIARIVPSEAMKLALAISLVAEHLPNPEQFFHFNSPYSRGAMLVARLAELVPPEGEARAELLANIIELANPVSFAAEVIRWLPTEDGASPDPFTQNDKAAAANRLVQRIEGLAAANEWIFDLYDREAPLLASIWAKYGTRQSLNEHIRQYLQQDEETVYRVLLAYVPKAYPMGGGLPRRSEFERSQYDSLAGAIDPEVINERLIELHGEQPIPEEYPRFSEDPIELQVARQFLWLHRHVSGENQDNPAEPGVDQA